MKRLTLDRTRVYAQTARNFDRSAFRTLVRACFGTAHVVRGVVDADTGAVTFFSGLPRRPRTEGLKR